MRVKHWTFDVNQQIQQKCSSGVIEHGLLNTGESAFCKTYKDN